LLAALPGRLTDLAREQWPLGIDHLVTAVVRLGAEPAATSLGLSSIALLCAYALAILRGRPR